MRRLLDEIDSRELAEWMAFAGLEGIGDERADFRAGQICATLANIHRKEDVAPFEAADFMPALHTSAPADGGEGTDESGALLLPDPEAHSRLIMQAVFGMQAAD